MTREEIAGYLKKNENLSRSGVISGFVAFAVSRGIKIDKIGKLLQDIQGYPEWRWEE